jgi:hypothetical protein
MGWTFTNKPKGQTVKDFFEKEFTNDGKTGVLDCAVVNRNVAYLAYKSFKDGHVFAIVCLLQYRPHDYYYNFGYKDMDESMGPLEHDCPERILNLLSPPSPGYATEWRGRCIANLEKKQSQPKVKKGNTIMFSTPLSFCNGVTESVFIVLNPRSSIFTGYGGGRFRIPNWKKHEYKVIEKGA